MRRSLRLTLSILSASALLTGSALFASHAGAQQTFQASGVAPPRPPVTQAVVDLATDRTTGQSNVATNGALDGVPVLNGFHFRFSNGDHELQRLGVAIATPAAANVFFRDKNADDPFKAEAAWINVKGAGVRGEVFVHGEGQFEAPLPTQRPAGTRLVLSGFGVTNFNDEDVQMVGVWLDESKNVARVTLYQRAPSFAGAELGMGYRGPGPGKGKYLGTIKGLGCNQSSTGNFKPVGFHIQYAFIPASLVDGDDYFTGSARAPSSGKVFGARAAIQGFEFLFEGKAHHLREIGVMPPLAGASTRSPTRIAAANEYVAFQDTNRDDAIKWAVKLLNLKP